MSRRSRRSTDGFSLSFLDVICCGFGAIILLLVLTKIGEPAALERAVEDLEGLVARLQQESFEIIGETRVLNRDMESREQQLSVEKESVARLRGDLSRIQGEFAAGKQMSEVNEIIEGRLLAAQQELTEEMKRLLGDAPRRPVTDATIGGIPVDSEYIIFIIDTSGSMSQNAWPAVRRKMTETLNIYPKVKGIQVLNDMGQYMFTQYAGKWIPDTPGRRKVIMTRLGSWKAFSNSSPVEGITRAIQTFASPNKKISLYVLGDEFSGPSIQNVLDTVNRINRKDSSGNRPVRIHAIGFPVVFSIRGASDYTGVRFATLMRQLCAENGGTFVALNTIR